MSNLDKLKNLLHWSEQAWATLDHNEHESLVSELGAAVDDVWATLTEEAAKERDALGYHARPIPITWRECE